MLRNILRWALPALVLLCAIAPADAAWRPEYAKSPQAVQDWFKNAEATVEACKAPGYPCKCCEQAERLRTKFVASPAGDWVYYVDPECTRPGCKTLPIPNIVVHKDRIRAATEEDDKLPEFGAMRREGVLFIYHGKPSCFWPPEGNDG
jgi:hypothetical protein